MNSNIFKALTYVLLISFILPITTSAQLLKKSKQFDEGIIQYKVSVIGDSELAEMFSETTLTVYLKGDKSKMDLRIMGGFASMQLLTNHTENTMLMDMPMLPEKVSIPMEGENNLFKQLMTVTHRNQAPSALGEVQYFPKDKKRIQKYKCYRAELPVKGSRDMVIFYVAQKLKADVPLPLLDRFENLEGLPLQIEWMAEGLNLRLTAVDLDQRPLESNIFEVPDDYMPRSLKELKEEINNIFEGGEAEGVGL